MNKKIIIFSDGGARGNPGPAGIGAVLYDSKKQVLAKISKYIGEATNNQAEYQALITALKKANDQTKLSLLEDELSTKIEIEESKKN